MQLKEIFPTGFKMVVEQGMTVSEASEKLLAGCGEVDDLGETIVPFTEALNIVFVRLGLKRYISNGLPKGVQLREELWR